MFGRCQQLWRVPWEAEYKFLGVSSGEPSGGGVGLDAHNFVGALMQCILLSTSQTQQSLSKGPEQNREEALI